MKDDFDQFGYHKKSDDFAQLKAGLFFGFHDTKTR
jgi:hypothetical protein